MEDIDPTLMQALLALVEVIDGCDYASDGTEGQPPNVYLQGLSMIRTKALQRAHAIGLIDYTTRDGIFNPQYHEAVSTAPGGIEGHIERVLRRGWTYSGRTIRHAQVIVFAGGGPLPDDLYSEDEAPAGGRRKLR